MEPEHNPSAPDEAVDPRKRLHDAARRLHRHEQELAKLRELRDDEIGRATLWFEDAASGELREIARLRNEIDGWARENRTDRVKSWKTPWGVVSTTATKGKTIIDDEPALLVWAVEHGFAEPQPHKILVGEIRKAALVDADTGRLILAKSEGDEYGPLPVPGVHVESTDAFNVHITIAESAW